MYQAGLTCPRASPKTPERTASVSLMVAEVLQCQVETSCNYPGSRVAGLHHLASSMSPNFFAFCKGKDRTDPKPETKNPKAAVQGSGPAHLKAFQNIIQKHDPSLGSPKDLGFRVRSPKWSRTLPQPPLPAHRQ